MSLLAFFRFEEIDALSHARVPQPLEYMGGDLERAVGSNRGEHKGVPPTPVRACAEPRTGLGGAMERPHHNLILTRHFASRPQPCT